MCLLISLSSFPIQLRILVYVQLLLFWQRQKFHQFRSQSSGANHSVHNLLSSCCFSCFSRWFASLLLCWCSFCLHQCKSWTQTIFSDNSLHDLIMCHSRNTTIANVFAEAERHWLFFNDVPKHHHDYCHRLGVVWLDWVWLLQSMAQIKCCCKESVCGQNNSTRTRIIGKQNEQSLTKISKKYT